MLENEEAIKLNELTDIMGNPVEEFKDLPDTEVFYASEQGEPQEGPGDVSFERARGVLSGAQGKVLTIIDATYEDGDSRKKYVKDLVRDAFSQQGNWLFELAMRDFEGEEA